MYPLHDIIHVSAYIFTLATYMNNVREVIREQRKVQALIGEDMGFKRQWFNRKINEDRFTPEEQVRLAELLGVTVEALFPDVNIEGVVA